MRYKLKNRKVIHEYTREYYGPDEIFKQQYNINGRVVSHKQYGRICVFKYDDNKLDFINFPTTLEIITRSAIYNGDVLKSLTPRIDTLYRTYKFQYINDRIICTRTGYIEYNSIGIVGNHGSGEYETINYLNYYKIDENLDYILF